MEEFQIKKPSAAAPQVVRSEKPIKHKKSNRGMWTVIIVVLVLVVGTLVGYQVYRKNPAPLSTINKSEYQAIFLANGQAYFGKIQQITPDYVKIANIYYLQAQANSPQPASKTQTDQQLTLIKLGSELHGPEDQMFIERSQVLFWENLKDGSKVVQAIHQSQSK